MGGSADDEAPSSSDEQQQDEEPVDAAQPDANQGGVDWTMAVIGAGALSAIGYIAWLDWTDLHVSVPVLMTCAGVCGGLWYWWRRLRTAVSLEVKNKSAFPVYVCICYQDRLSSRLLPASTACITVPAHSERTVVKPAASSTRSRFLVFSTRKEKIQKVVGSGLKALERLNYSTARVELDSSISLVMHKGTIMKERVQDRVAEATSGIKSVLSKTLEKKARSALTESYVSTAERYLHRQAQCRRSFENPKCEEEEEYIAERLQRTCAALSKFLEMDLEIEDVPRVALCASGGGYRAMFSTLGFLRGLDQIGCLDGVAYAAGVSGSTWALSQWYGVPDEEESKDVPRINAVLDNVTKKAEVDLMSAPRSDDEWRSLKQYISSQFGYSLPVTIVDGWGIMISNTLLKDFRPPGTRYRITDFASEERILNYEVPLPIFTAVFLSHEEKYEWFEFTPFEAGSEYSQRYVPAWAFGRRFSEGVSQCPALPVALGAILGTAGSAFCADFQCLLKEAMDKANFVFGSSSDGNEDEEDLEEDDVRTLFDIPVREKLEEGLDSLREEVKPVAERMKKLFDTKGISGVCEEVLADAVKSGALASTHIALQEFLGSLDLAFAHAIPPAKFHNPAYEDPRGKTKRLQYLDLMDAGIDFNLPWPALLRRANDIDVVIALDATAPPDIVDGLAMTGGREYAKRYEHPFPILPEDMSTLQAPDATVLEEYEDGEAGTEARPRVVYIPLVQNPEYSEFDPQANTLEGEYCSSFNFVYSKEQADELSGLTTSLIHRNVDALKETLRNAVMDRRRRRMSEF